ncbi:MAG: zinc ribbon domain-containing protein [Bacillota bacterium]
MHSWAFFQLKEYIRYKARSVGIPVVDVDPKHTSQRCFNCGTIKKRNRRGQAYCCGCKYTAHADLNAARNIAMAQPLT